LLEYEEGDVPTLFVKCRSCGHEIPTPVAEPKTGAEGVMITGLRIKCPDCGHDDRYSTADLHVRPTGKSSPAGAPVTSQENLAGEHEAKLKGEQEKLAGLGIVPPEGRSPHEG
jgi:ribosomal protein S27E